MKAFKKKKEGTESFLFFTYRPFLFPTINSARSEDGIGSLGKHKLYPFFHFLLQHFKKAPFPYSIFFKCWEPYSTSSSDLIWPTSVHVISPWLQLHGCKCQKFTST